MVDASNPEGTAEDAAKADWDQWYRTQAEQIKSDIDSSTDSFDKSMLTLSSGALGVSLAFIKDIVPLGQAAWICLLLASWIAFALCIVTTVVSFRFSIAALKKQRDFLDEIWSTRNSELLNKKTFHWKALAVCTYSALVLFLVGLACTVIFVVKNVSSFHTGDSAKTAEAATVTDVRNFYMSDHNKASKTIEKVVIPDGLKRGREPAKMMPAPATTAPTIPAAPASTATPAKSGETAPVAPCTTKA